MSFDSASFGTMDRFSDPFCFNTQTSTLLRGLGASDLIPECKKRNISTDVLHELNTEELIMLGAKPEKAKEIKNALHVRRRRSGVIVTNIEDRLQHFLEIVKHGEQQLSLIQALVAYSRLRLLKERINIFVNPDKCLSASNILSMSVNVTLTEVDEAERNLNELEELILRMKLCHEPYEKIEELKEKPRRNNNTPRFYILITGLGLVTFILLKGLSH